MMERTGREGYLRGLVTRLVKQRGLSREAAWELVLSDYEAAKRVNPFMQLHRHARRRRYMATWRRNKREERRAAGLCTECGQPSNRTARCLRCSLRRSA